jgi:Flp pilus assembly pilin Flp
MTLLMQCIWTEDDGALTFEWTLLLTLLTIGIVGGVSGARDAIIDELGDTAQVMQAVDQSYRIGFPLLVQLHNSSTGSAGDSTFTDAMIYNDCGPSEVPIDLSPIGGFIGQDFVDDGFPDGA